MASTILQLLLNTLLLVHNNNRHSKQNKLKTRTEVSEKDTSDVEKRRESIRQKLTSFINPVFTEVCKAL